MGNYPPSGSSAITESNTESSSPLSPSEKEEQLQYLRKVRVLPRVERQRREQSGSSDQGDSDPRIWVYGRPEMPKAGSGGGAQSAHGEKFT